MLPGAGHTVAVNKQTYTHVRPEDMTVALAALSKIQKEVSEKVRFSAAQTTKGRVPCGGVRP